jgi:hypothetical protein
MNHEGVDKGGSFSYELHRRLMSTAAYRRDAHEKQSHNKVPHKLPRPSVEKLPFMGLLPLEYIIAELKP